MFLQKLDSTLFSWELWEANCWDALDLSFSKSMELDKLLGAIKKYGIGYCDAEDLSVRPRLGYYAVMCQRDGETFWFHVLKKDFEEE